MGMIIDQQVALDEALVPHASRLRIGKSNFRLRSDITSKESTLQVVHDVLRLTSFYKAFLAIADVPEIYMEMLHICPRIPNQTFDKLPFKEEILAFLRYLGHSGEIKKITDVNINKLHQPWRSFATVINKCLNGKSTVDHKDAKKSNKMYYPRFIKVIINFFMTKDPLIPRRNKVNWHYVRDDQMFITIKLVSRHYNTQRFGAMLPVKLTNEDIRNSAAYKEYYAIASGAAPPKTKASVRTTQSSSYTTMPPPKAAGTRLSTIAKGKQPAKSSNAKVFVLSEKSSDKDDDDVDDQSDAAADDDDQKDEDEQDDDNQDDNDDDQDSDNDGDDFVHPKLSTHNEEAKDEESFDHIVQTPSQVENSKDESNDDESHGMNVGGDEGPDAEYDDEELYRDVNINLEGRDVQMTDVHTTQVLEDTHVTLTLVNPDGQQQISTTVVPLLMTAPTLPPPSIPIMSQVQQVPIPSPTTAPSLFLQDLPNFSSLFRFDHRLKTLEANFSEFMQTNKFVGAVSSIPAQAENEDFLNKLDENIQKIIKEQVKEQVKVQVSKILPKIEKTVNEQLGDKVLTRASNSSKTSYDVASDLSELELKKILIEKMKSNKSIHRSDEQRNLYKALVDAYECDNIILDTYVDTVTLKKRRDDEDKDEEPSAGSDRGPREDEKEKSQSQQVFQRKRHPRPLTCLLKSPNLTKRLDLAKQADSYTSFNELMDTYMDFSTFLMNRLKVDTMILELLAGLTYEPMKGSCKKYPHNLLKPLPLIPNSKGRQVIPFDHFINNDLEYLHGGASSRKYTTSVTKTKAADYGHVKWIEDLVPRTMWSQALVSYDKYALCGISHWGCKHQQLYGFVVNRESARDVYSKRRISALTNLTVKERFAFNVSLRMFTRSIVIQRRVEDLQLGVESYQKKLNLTKPDTYMTDLKRKETYTAYSNPKGFIYQNKDKQNRLMRIDDLQKFSDGTLNNVRTALDDCLKGSGMKYLPQTIWKRSDEERAAAMIQAINKQLKTRRIMRSLEKFVGGRLYEGDFRILQRTI
nr:hypothetical protein [Tanacetum cinerariifolium]